MLTHNDLQDSPQAERRFAWLSAPGVAALSLLFLHPDAGAAFRGALAKPPRKPRHLWLTNDSGNPIDEVMACRERGGILLTCHGGPAVRRALEAELLRAGFRQTQLEPFGQTTFEAATLGLLPRVQGAGAVALVLEAAAQAEALARALAGPVAELLAESAAARFLIDPPRVQLWGPVNAGKSSLLNALCGRDLAAVGQEPGLTRDVIEGRLEYDGFVIRLFDAPGIWAGHVGLDVQAQQLAQTWRRQADLTIELTVGASPHPAEGWLLHSRADEHPGCPEPSVSTRRPETLRALKDRLLEHFFGPLRRLPPERRFALHPALRADLSRLAKGEASADELRAKWLESRRSPFQTLPLPDGTRP